MFQARTNQQLKPWAIPFELKLAADKFSCYIHVIHYGNSADYGNTHHTHHCYKPSIEEKNESPIPLSRRVFLRSDITSEGQFWFRWYRTRAKLQTSQYLFGALHSWLSQENVRPISAHLLEQPDQCLTQQMISESKATIPDSQLEQVCVFKTPFVPILCNQSTF